MKKDGPLDPWEVPYFVRTFYDQLFKTSERCYVIRDGRYELKGFDEHNNPLRLVSKTTREGLLENTGLRRRAWEYRTYRIQEIQGLDFQQWLALPPHVLENILSDIRREEEHRKAITNRENNQIDDMTKGDLSRQLGDVLFRNSKAL